MVPYIFFLQSVVVAVLGLAKLVEEEDNGLKAEHEDDTADETGSIERRFLLRSGRQRCCGGICKKKKSDFTHVIRCTYCFSKKSYFLARCKVGVSTYLMG